MVHEKGKDMRHSLYGCNFFVALFTVALTWNSVASANDSLKRIQISGSSPAYWQYGDEPILLLGGSREDNLFQIPDIKAHLDLLKSVGGNYVRNTMSCRDEGDVWPFRKIDGKYDLNQWNDVFWSRFETFLRLTQGAERLVEAS